MPINPFFTDNVDNDIEKDMEEQQVSEMSLQYEKATRFINNKLDLDFATLDCAAYCNHHGVTSLERTAQAILGYETLAYGAEGIGDVFQSIWSGICTLLRKICEFFAWIWDLIVKMFRRITGKADENKQAEIITNEVEKEVEKVIEEVQKSEAESTQIGDGNPIPDTTDKPGNYPSVGDGNTEEPEEEEKEEDQAPQETQEDIEDRIVEKLYRRLMENSKLRELLEPKEIVIHKPKEETSEDNHDSSSSETEPMPVLTNEDNPGNPTPKKAVEDREGYFEWICNEIKVAYKSARNEKNGFPKHKVWGISKMFIRRQREKLLKALKPTASGMGFVMHDALKSNTFLRDGIHAATKTAQTVIDSIELALKGTLNPETPMESEKIKFNGKEMEVFVPRGVSLAYGHTNSLDTLSEMLQPKKKLHMPGKKFVISTESLYDCGYTGTADEDYNKVVTVMQAMLYNSETEKLAKSSNALAAKLKVIDTNYNPKNTDPKNAKKQEAAKKQTTHLQGEHFGDKKEDTKQVAENLRKARLKILRNTTSFIGELSKLLKQLNGCLLLTYKSLNKVFVIHSKYTITK